MRRQLLNVAGAAVTALLAGNVYAAPTEAPAAAPVAEPAKVIEATAPKADAPAALEQTAAKAPRSAIKGEALSNKEKLSRSQEHLGTMRMTLKAILSKLEEARTSKDVVRVNCVNEKLTNIKGLLRISEQADVSLQEAVAKSEEQAAEHEFSKITIARQKVDQLRAEAEQCVGQLAFEAGATKVTVEESKDLPNGDPTQAAPLPPVTTRPAPASATN